MLSLAYRLAQHNGLHIHARRAAGYARRVPHQLQHFGIGQLYDANLLRRLLALPT